MRLGYQGFIQHTRTVAEGTQKSCVGCHFLCKEVVGPGVDLIKVIDSNERHQLARNIYVNRIDSDSIIQHFKCYLDVWDKAIKDSAPIDLFKVVNEVRDADYCYFYPYAEGVEFETAKRLQAETKETEQYQDKAKWYTSIVFLLAVAFLILGVLKYLE